MQALLRFVVAHKLIFSIVLGGVLLVANIVLLTQLAGEQEWATLQMKDGRVLVGAVHEQTAAFIAIEKVYVMASRNVIGGVAQGELFRVEDVGADEVVFTPFAAPEEVVHIPIGDIELLRELRTPNLIHQLERQAEGAI